MAKYITYKPELDAMNDVATKRGITLSRIIRLAAQSEAQEGGNYFNSNDLRTHTCEYAYTQGKRDVIFIEDQSTLDFLMNLRYKLPQEEAKIPFPFDSFSVAIPAGLEYDGIKIPPFLVYCGEMRIPSLSAEFLKDAGVIESRPESHDLAIADGAAAPINVIIPSSQAPLKLQPKSMLRITHGQLLTLLSIDINDVETADKLTGFNSLASLSREEVKVQLIVLKLLVAMSIYNNATEYKHLVVGVPAGLNNKAKHLGMQKDTMKHCNFKKLKLKQRQGSSGEKVVEGYMRNLQHEKYYKGVFAHLEPKSRWVEVSGWVSGHVDAKTQTTN